MFRQGINKGWVYIVTELGLTCSSAYSVRKIVSGYSGSCIRVRRSFDNVEQDIGFVNNLLDTASLLSFIGVNSGYIAKWYDQSGNARDAVQSTTSAQPRIVNAGTLETNNNRPSIRFFSNGLFLPAYKFAAPSTNWTYSNVVAISSATGGVGNNSIIASDGQFQQTGIYNTVTSSSTNFVLSWSGNTAGGSASPATGISTVSNNLFMLTGTHTSANSAKLSISGNNGSSFSTTGWVAGAQSYYNLGRYSNGNVTNDLIGYFSEHISWSEALTDNQRLILEYNQGEFYGRPVK